MVDFSSETPLTVKAAAAFVDKEPITIRRWFTRGLDWCKLGGTVYTSREALNRFRTGGGMNDQHTVQAIVVDRETLEAMKRMGSRGFKFGQGATDGKAKPQA